MENNTETDKILLTSGIFFKAKLDIFMDVFFWRTILLNVTIHYTFDTAMWQ